MGQGDMGTSLPSLPHFPPWRQVRGWDGLTLVLSGLCDRRAQTPAPGLHGALNTSVMGWEARGCFSGLPCCWDNAVSDP